MERVTFLIEENNQRFSCLLNPETLVIRRAAGLQTRRSAGGKLTGGGLNDDPLIFTGGGRTELEMDLLFDISLATPPDVIQDVRDLTGPLWQLTENSASGVYGAPPLVRFIWGKSWNIPGMVTALSERLEYFTSDGTPQRSWLRMRLVRVNEPVAQETPSVPPLPEIETPSPLDTATLPGVEPEEITETIEATGGDGAQGEGVRLDLIAFEVFGDASYWRLIAAYNGIADPMNVPSGTILRIPPRPE